MRYIALCCDYDGTIAHHGTLDGATLAALERFRAAGRRLVLVTGRELDDLQRICPRLDLFDRVVAENGALLYRPATGEDKRLGEPPPAEFIAALRARGVEQLSVGRVIVATWEPYQHQVLQAIHDLGLELQVIFNKGAVMVLPAGINKASGLKCALAEMGLSVHNAVGVGDAENDHAFLSICECAVAVANALPALKERADIVTRGEHGAGIVELIDELLANELVRFEPRLTRHHIALGHDAQGKLVSLSPYGINALLVGTSGGGKSTVAVGLVERLRANDYSFCIVDPEGDYDNVESAVVIGSPEHVPSLDECVQLISKPAANAVINLLGLKLEDRPAFFLSLFARVTEMRRRTGRPHLLIIDEAHHVLPASWQPTDAHKIEHLDGVLLVSVTPNLVARSILRAVDTVIVLGEKPREMLQEFAAANDMTVNAAAAPLATGTALLWNKAQHEPLLVQLEPSRTERRRHLRKYAAGELPPDRSFYFRGPENKLKLRAHNLILFMDLADGVDDDTWRYHLERGEISAWIAEHIKDPGLAQQIALIEQDHHLSPAQSRERVRSAIEALYTLPAPVSSG